MLDSSLTVTTSQGDWERCNNALQSEIDRKMRQIVWWGRVPHPNGRKWTFWFPWFDLKNAKIPEIYCDECQSSKNACLIPRFGNYWTFIFRNEIQTDAVVPTSTDGRKIPILEHWWFWPHPFFCITKLEIPEGYSRWYIMLCTGLKTFSTRILLKFLFKDDAPGFNYSAGKRAIEQSPLL